ncbi:MAG: squalene/phytoene synthase family protein [Bacteroidetes bacterium]|nr:squalene/phytoene synthase family protein [Bacteroidota bacterium]
MLKDDNLNKLAITHYENFPVGSFLIPKKYRDALHLIYAFARVADDIADELNDTKNNKIKLLEEWENNLNEAIDKNSDNPFFIKLANQIEQFKIPLKYFSDLIIAFKMDCNHSQPKNMDELLFYCTKSANPIGRIYLTLIGKNTDENFILSDNLCTALQVTNFVQDISIDSKRNRFYIPFSIENGILYNSKNNYYDKKNIISSFIKIIKDMFINSKPLINKLSYPFNLELSLIWNGGMRIINKIEKDNFAILTQRPKLFMNDKIYIFLKSIINK